MYTELTGSNQQRQIRVWADQERCESMFVRIFPQPRSRCVETGPARLVIALRGAEVRLLAWLQVRIHSSQTYRFWPATRRANRNYIAGARGCVFRAVYRSEDMRVTIGFEKGERIRRPVVRLLARRGGRVRKRRDGWTWRPTIAEVNALAQFYGRPVPVQITEADRAATARQLQQMRERLAVKFAETQSRVRAK